MSAIKENIKDIKYLIEQTGDEIRDYDFDEAEAAFIEMSNIVIDAINDIITDNQNNSDLVRQLHELSSIVNITEWDNTIDTGNNVSYYRHLTEEWLNNIDMILESL